MPNEAKKYPQRTLKQNAALHVYFKLVADVLNDSGLDMRKVLKPQVEIPWSAETIKEYIWRPIMKAQLNKGSTTEMTTVDIDAVFDTINRHLGEKFGVTEPFPSYDNILTAMEDERRLKRSSKAGKQLKEENTDGQD